jgi:hypothetical protein
MSWNLQLLHLHNLSDFSAWNLSFEATHGFLFASNFGLPELKDDPLRVHKLVRFVNYVLGVNAAAWQREEPFLTCGALKQEFGTFLQCQSFGVLIPATPANNSQNNHNSRGGGGRFNCGGFRYNGGGRGGGRSAPSNTEAVVEAVSSTAAVTDTTTAQDLTIPLTIACRGVSGLPTVGSTSARTITWAPASRILRTVVFPPAIQHSTCATPKKRAASCAKKCTRLPTISERNSP